MMTRRNEIGIKRQGKREKGINIKRGQLKERKRKREIWKLKEMEREIKGSREK
jgi:hypothetical protein